jgi:hypothetical protein
MTSQADAIITGAVVAAVTALAGLWLLTRHDLRQLRNRVASLEITCHPAGTTRLAAALYWEGFTPGGIIGAAGVTVRGDPLCRIPGCPHCWR